MRIAYQYRLQPTYEQRLQMGRWLDMLRCQYNWMLSDRFDWWEMNRYRTFTFPQESGPGASAHYKTRIP